MLSRGVKLSIDLIQQSHFGILTEVILSSKDVGDVNWLLSLINLNMLNFLSSIELNLKNADWFVLKLLLLLFHGVEMSRVLVWNVMGWSRGLLVLIVSPSSVGHNLRSSGLVDTAVVREVGSEAGRLLMSSSSSLCAQRPSLRSSSVQPSWLSKGVLWLVVGLSVSEWLGESIHGVRSEILLSKCSRWVLSHLSETGLIVSISIAWFL